MLAILKGVGQDAAVMTNGRTKLVFGASARELLRGANWCTRGRMLCIAALGWEQWHYFIAPSVRHPTKRQYASKDDVWWLMRTNRNEF